MFLPSLRIASRSAAVSLAAALLACVTLSANAATTASHGDIVAVTVHGSVTATMAGMTVPLSGGAILQLPATVRTGADGAVELRQGTSTFAAAGNTELEIPQSAAEDGLIERIIQIRGNAFYNVGKRTGTRLRVEAPYLVAVIKGTQFNVAAQDDNTTIALYEGHLEVRASDDSDVVDLDAGEIAIRRRDDVSISVLRLNAARDTVRRNPELAARQQNEPALSNTVAVTTDAVTARNAETPARPGVDTRTRSDDATPIDSGTTIPTERGRTVETLPDTEATVTAKAAVDLGSIDSVAPSVDSKVEVNVADARIDVGAGAEVAVSEVAAVDTSVAAVVDVPAGAVDVAVDATVAAGDVVAVDAGATAAVDVAADTIDAGLDTSVASTDVAAAVGVDAGAGNVSADVGVGPVDVGLDVGTGGVGLDLGLGAEDDSSSGGLLGGLLGRKRRD